MELSFVLGIFSLARCPAAGSSGGRGCQVLPRVHGGDAVSQMQCHSAMCCVPEHPAGRLVWGSCREWSPSKSIIHILKTYGPPASPRGLCSCHCQAGLESQGTEVCWCPFPCSSSCKASTAGTLWRSRGGDTDASSLVSC